MKLRTLAILGVIAAALLAAAVSLYMKRSTEYEAQTPTALYPGLRHRVNEIAQIRISGPHGEFHIDLIDGMWRMREKGGYPIRTENIRAAVTSLSDLVVIEPKTSRPENYPLLGVQDPGEGKPSILVEMMDRANQPVVSMVLGTIEPGMTPDVSRRYVRKTDDPRVYFIDGIAAVEPDPTRWIDKEVMRFARAWTHDVTITHPDGETLQLVRESIDARDFQISGLPDNAVIHDSRDVSLLGNLFVYIGMDDVAKADTAPEDQRTPGPVGVVRGFDGFQATARLFDYEGQTWATFEAAVVEPLIDVDAAASDSAEAEKLARASLRTPDEVAAAVEEFNNRLGGWRFLMIDSKVEHFNKRLADLVDLPN